MLIVTVAPTSNDLTILETAQRELDLAQGDMTGLAELIQKASAACAEACGRPEGFGRATVRQTERLTCARDYIILERDLAPTIASVVEGADTLAGTDYEVDGALLYRLEDDERTEWPAEKIVITYSAGYSTLSDLPHAIESACLLTLAQMIAARGENPMVRRFDNGLISTSYANPEAGIPPTAAQLLAPYRRITL